MIIPQIFTGLDPRRNGVLTLKKEKKTERECKSFEN